MGETFSRNRNSLPISRVQAKERERDHDSKHSSQSIPTSHLSPPHTHKVRQRELVDSPGLQPVLLAADGRQGTMELSIPLVAGVVVVPLKVLGLLAVHNGCVGAAFAVG